MDAVLAHRAEQRLREPAVSPAPHHEQVGAPGRVQQHLRRGALSVTVMVTGTCPAGSTVLATASLSTLRGASVKSASGSTMDGPKPYPVAR